MFVITEIYFLLFNSFIQNFIHIGTFISHLLTLILNYPCFLYVFIIEYLLKIFSELSTMRLLTFPFFSIAFKESFFNIYLIYQYCIYSILRSLLLKRSYLSYEL